MSKTTRAVRRAVLGVTTIGVVAGLLTPPSAAAGITSPPAGLAPADIGTTQYKNVELTWAAVPGATSYDVQVDDDLDFATDVLAGTTSIAAFTVPVSLPRGGYAWRVRARSSTTIGPWSTAAQFVRGWAEQPAGLVATSGMVPELSWAAMPDASFYEVEISNKPFGTFTGRMNSWICYTSKTSLTPYGVALGEERPPGNEADCPFTLDETAGPGADGSLPAAFYPGDFFWRVRGRDTTVDDRDTKFPAPAGSCTGVWQESGGTGDADGVTVPLPYGPPDYLKNAECSRWSDEATLTVTPSDASAGTEDYTATVTGLSMQPVAGGYDPTAAAVKVTDTPRFAWSPAPRAWKYRVYVSRTADFRDADHVWETQGTSLQPVGDLADRSLPTYWAVQACGAFTCGPVSAMSSFTKAWRASPPSTTLASSTVRSGNMLTLTWGTGFSGTDAPAAVPAGSRVAADPAVRSYELQLDEVGGDFSAPLGQGIVTDRVGATPGYARYRMDVARAPVQFQWRVRGLTDAGDKLPWYAAATYDVTKPVASIITPTGFSATTPLKVSFTEPVGGVSTSTLRVVPVDAPTSPVAGTLTKLSSTSWSFRPAAGFWNTGRSYKLAVSSGISDLNGLAATASPTSVRVARKLDNSSPAMIKHVGDWGWTTYSASDAYGRTYSTSKDTTTTAKRSNVQVIGYGSKAYLYLCKGPSGGIAKLYVDGVLTASIDTYRSYSGCGLAYTSPTLSTKLHSFRVYTTGTKNAASRSTEVSVDAITIA